MSRSAQIARAAGVFAMASMLFFAVSVVLARGWEPALMLPELAPGDEKPVPRAPAGPVSQASASLPADPADPSMQTKRAWLVRPSVPSTSAAGYPGVVLIHAAGSGSRDSLLGEARALAAAGVAAIVYDKRTRGYSAVRRDYQALADDAVRAADVLRASPDVDRDRIGLMGWSEGGWVASLAAQPGPDRFAFVALASAPVVSPLEQTAWTARRALPSAPAWLEKTIATALGSGRWLMPHLDHDTEPALSALRVPVFAVWGGTDPTVPVNQAARSLLDGVPAPVSVHVVPHEGHSLTIESRYLDRAAQWMHGLELPAADELRGSEPESTLGIGRVPALAWYSHPLLHLVLGLALAIGSLRLSPVRQLPGLEGVVT